MYDVIVIGAGAAGLMAAGTAGLLGKKVCLIEHSKKIGEKIRISGGGRCNFTNLHAAPVCYLSQNPHFVKSALAGFTQHDFIQMVQKEGIAYHEKTLGQLFCDGPSKHIIDLLLKRCHEGRVHIEMQCAVSDIIKSDHFKLETNKGVFESRAVIIASGGLSIPLIGASDFAYRMAKKFGLKIVPTKPGLVPLIVKEDHRHQELSGISQFARASYGKTFFDEALLFTHKGLSGPAILQISSYLKSLSDDTLTLNLLPAFDLLKSFLDAKNSKQTIANFLKRHMASRLVDALNKEGAFDKSLADSAKAELQKIARLFQEMQVPISGSEGYAKAEVTTGGIDTEALSSKTMECKNIKGLYFIGEALDVTGWLGGYNFQWAWSSGYAAAKALLN